MAPCSKLSRSCMVCGSVSARTVAPRAEAALPAASWLQAPSAFMAETPRTFQLTGRSASSDMVARKSMSSALNPLRQPATMSSTVVPSCCAHRGSEALHLLAGRRPRRDGLAVAVVVGVHLRGREAERPLRQRRVQRRLHGVDVVRRGRAADGALAHDEPAQRRVADEEARRSPRCGRRGCPSQSPKELQSHGTPARSAASGMPSTRAIIREM